jgi:hypothetical protein
MIKYITICPWLAEAVDPTHQSEYFAILAYAQTKSGISWSNGLTDYAVDIGNAGIGHVTVQWCPRKPQQIVP